MTWCLRWGIYKSMPNWTQSQNSLAAVEAEFKDILPWNNSQMVTKTILISTRIVISYEMKRGILYWVYWEVTVNWDNNVIRISQWIESHCRTNICVRRKKSKSARLWESQSGIQVVRLNTWVRSFKKEFTRSISSTRIT